MQLYEKSIIVDIIESKILDTYPQYYPQGQYNSTFIKYFYDYLRKNIYSGSHSKLLQDLLSLQSLSKTLVIKENTDKQTYVLTDDSGITTALKDKLNTILENYPNYEYLIDSENRIVIKVAFGWLPNNTSCLLNLLSSENIINYSINKETNVLQPNESSTPDYVCYRIDDINADDTILFLVNDAITFDPNVKYKDVTFASLLVEVEGSEGATLNRVVTIDSPESAFYEVGPNPESYLSTNKVSLIIQVPYVYAINNGYYVLNVKNSVKIKKDKTNLNNTANFFVPFSQYIGNISFATDLDTFRHENDSNIKRYSIKINENKGAVVYDDGSGNLIQSVEDKIVQVGTVDYSNATFSIIPNSIPKPYDIKYQIIYEDKFDVNTLDVDSVEEILDEGIDKLDLAVIQYALGDFIWKTADSKLIAYTQNLINSLYPTANILVNGIWSEKLSNYIIKFKQVNRGASVLFYDDVLDKLTEEAMTTQYVKTFNRDFNELFTEW